MALDAFPFSSRAKAPAPKTATTPGFAPPALQTLHPTRMLARRKPIKPVGGIAKRALDILVSLSALIGLAPVLLLIALIIRLESRGPALFRQRRRGFRGRRFIIFKFRSMRTMDDGTAVVQASRRDPRVTAFGAFLRRSSLDELPQLLNVLCGHMSIVGPRPHAVAHDSEFLDVEPKYRERWRARPGITGLAQVNGSRGELKGADAVRERVRLDLKYIARWSVLLDVWIMLRTVLLVFRDRKAF